MASRKPAPKKPAEPTPEADKATQFIVDGVTYEIDADNLTWGQMADIEEHFGKSLDDLGNTNSLIALVTLAMQAKRPATTFDEVRSFSVKAISFDGEERPTSTPAPVGSPS